tara:strand:+ start:121 stop:579 length:459 start_codon:yes stop_codon:yes gene_type:complete
MSKKIYNKNAREKALLEEAYSNVYTEEVSEISGERWSEEWSFDEFSPQLKKAIKHFEKELSFRNIARHDPRGDESSIHELKLVVDEIVNDNVLDDDVKEQAIEYLKQISANSQHLNDDQLYGQEGIFSGLVTGGEFYPDVFEGGGKGQQTGL